MSDLVGNPEDRFSRVAAHIIFTHTLVNLLAATVRHYYILEIKLKTFCNGSKHLHTVLKIKIKLLKLVWFMCFICVSNEHNRQR